MLWDVHHVTAGWKEDNLKEEEGNNQYVIVTPIKRKSHDLDTVSKGTTCSIYYSSVLKSSLPFHQRYEYSV